MWPATSTDKSYARHTPAVPAHRSLDDHFNAVLEAVRGTAHISPLPKPQPAVGRDGSLPANGYCGIRFKLLKRAGLLPVKRSAEHIFYTSTPSFLLCFRFVFQLRSFPDLHVVDETLMNRESWAQHPSTNVQKSALRRRLGATTEQMYFKMPNSRFHPRFNLLFAVPPTGETQFMKLLV